MKFREWWFLIFLNPITGFLALAFGISSCLPECSHTGTCEQERRIELQRQLPPGCTMHWIIGEDIKVVTCEGKKTESTNWRGGPKHNDSKTTITIEP